MCDKIHRQKAEGHYAEGHYAEQHNPERHKSECNIMPNATLCRTTLPWMRHNAERQLYVGRLNSVWVNVARHTVGVSVTILGSWSKVGHISGSGSQNNEFGSTALICMYVKAGEKKLHWPDPGHSSGSPALCSCTAVGLPQDPPL